ncbi:MAG: hypothetical protein ACKO37_04855 [Vampirovibrionales bacterium]
MPSSEFPFLQWREDAWHALDFFPSSWLAPLSLGCVVVTTYPASLTSWAWHYHQVRLLSTLEKCFPTLEPQAYPPWLVSCDGVLPIPPFFEGESESALTDKHYAVRLLGIPSAVHGGSLWRPPTIEGVSQAHEMVWIMQRRELPLSSAPVSLKEVLWQRQGLLAPFKLGGTLLEGLWEQSVHSDTLMWVKPNGLAKKRIWLETPTSSWFALAWDVQAQCVVVLMPNATEDTHRLYSTSCAMIRLWVAQEVLADRCFLQEVATPLNREAHTLLYGVYLVNALRGIQPVVSVTTLEGVEVSLPSSGEGTDAMHRACRTLIARLGHWWQHGVMGCEGDLTLSES